MDKIIIEKVTSFDDVILKDLASRCKPLDIHTQYTYWVMCNYCQECSNIIKVNDEIAGFIMCVTNNDVIFIWQVGVLPEFRRKGLSQMLIEEVFESAKYQNKKIQFTVLEENKASYNSFKKLCDKHGKSLKMIEVIYEGTDHEELKYEISD